MLFAGVAGHGDEDLVSGRLVRRGAVAGSLAAPPVWDPAAEAIYILRGGGVSRAGHSWAGLHLAIASGRWCGADVVIDPASEERDALWERRLVPFRGQPAHRPPGAQTAAGRTGRAGPGMAAASAAADRPAAVQLGRMITRVDHIGSTSVPGLPAKQLIDIQVVVSALALAGPVADAARRSGFVRAPGVWFGTDQRGVDHPEEVVVDADPGRSVNINGSAIKLSLPFESVYTFTPVGAASVPRPW
ncbi:MAG TPA: GrpB family protein [Streptosporangiaceae bacterium]|nr:GrpB family protein [Streptosporangiaceae bacterium]